MNYLTIFKIFTFIFIFNELLIDAVSEIEHDDHHDDHHATNKTHIETTLTSSEKWGYSFLGTTIGVSAVFVAPLFFKLFKHEKISEYLPFFSLFGFGAILSLVINHNIPEIGEVLTFNWITGSVFLTGMVVNYIGIYGFTKEDHCCEVLPITKSDNLSITTINDKNKYNCNENNINNKHNTKHWSISILLGDCFCNFSDGLIITSAFHICGHELGWITVLNVFLHEVTHEISDFSILINSGYTFRKAILLNLLSASTSYISWLIVNLISNNIKSANIINAYILTFGSGVVISFVVSLIPKYLKDKSVNKQRWKLLILLLGIIICTLIFISEKHCHH
jgi:zinc transporter ZupT